MIEIRNLKFQPLTLHLANSKRSVHLRPRGRTEINEKDVSVEMRRAAERGFITLREVKSKKPDRDITPAGATTNPKSAPKPQASDATPKERS